MKTVIVIPAYNEGRVINRVVHDVLNAGYSHVVVVDDGSADDTAAQAAEAGAKVVTHRLNRGKGVAATTGIEAACTIGADIIVTMDGDGQHEAGDIKNLIAPILRGEYDVVFGVRPFTNSDMPKTRIMFNQVGNLITSTLTGIYVSDSQSGLRAFSRRAAEMIETVASQYEYETEVIREIAYYNLPFTEVPIAARYTAYSMNKGHGQGITSGARTLYRMFWNRLSL